MLELLIENYVYVVLVVITIILIIVSITYRKQLLEKIKNETISFTALCVSLTLTLISFITKSSTEVTTLAYINGQRISFFIPIFLGFVVLSIIFLIIFFRKELTKDISLR